MSASRGAAICALLPTFFETGDDAERSIVAYGFTSAIVPGGCFRGLRRTGLVMGGSWASSSDDPFLHGDCGGGNTGATDVRDGSVSDKSDCNTVQGLDSMPPGSRSTVVSLVPVREDLLCVGLFNVDSRGIDHGGIFSSCRRCF